MKRILSFFLIFSTLFSLTACRRPAAIVDTSADAPMVFLLAGLDAAAENTDVLCLLSVDLSADRMAIMQIPRDTYYRADSGDGKINAIYAAARARGDSAEQSLASLSSAISETFSVSLTASVAFTTAALRAAVDAMGGVAIHIPSDMVIEGKHYPAGEHLLSGVEAEAFVRYREGYLMGDLGRVDAQKLFLSALLKRASDELNPAALLRLLLSMRSDVITDLSLPRALSIGLSLHARLSSLSAVFFTLPGEPLLYRGHWYYIANKKSSEALLRGYFPFAGGFDTMHRLYNADDLSHSNIYTDTNFPYLVYTEDDLSSLSIQTKKE